MMKEVSTMDNIKESGSPKDIEAVEGFAELSDEQLANVAGGTGRYECDGYFYFQCPKCKTKYEKNLVVQKCVNCGDEFPTL